MSQSAVAWIRRFAAIGLLVSLGAGQAFAQPVLPLPGGMLVEPNVRSMHALRYANMVQQTRDFSCGAAALATILDYGYGMRLSEAQVIEGMFAVTHDKSNVLRRGFSMLDMKRYVQGIGLHGVGFEVNVTALHALRIPVIALLDIQGYLHFVVVRRVSERWAYISDPALGDRVMNVSDFEQQWNGLVFAVIGKPFPADSPLLHHNELLADKLRSSLLDHTARTVDFGLIPGRLF